MAWTDSIHSLQACRNMTENSVHLNLARALVGIMLLAGCVMRMPAPEAAADTPPLPAGGSGEPAVLAVAPPAELKRAKGRFLALLAANADGQFQRILGPVPLSFPADHGAHSDYMNEWWYFTGNLADEQGEEYGYQLTFFRIGLSPELARRHLGRDTLYDRTEMFMGHMAVTDVVRQTHRYAQRFSRAVPGLGEVRTGTTVSIVMDDWQAVMQENGEWRLVAQATDKDDQSFSFSLTLTADGPPVLHGDEGFSRKGREPGLANIYYSLVGLDTTGELHMDSRTLQVQGVSWFDHEWGTAPIPGNGVGWDWFSLQWPDGSALMSAIVHLDTGEVDPTFLHTYVTPKGQIHKLQHNEISVTEVDYWRSPHTSTWYPSGWVIEIPKFALQCAVSPLVANQEFQGIIHYWEGAVQAHCNRNGREILGRGYTELVGYAAG